MLQNLSQKNKKGGFLMKELTNMELKQVYGGSLSIWGIISIIASAIFGIGIIDGIVRPLGCR